jgi:hypothetical protein
MDGIQDIFRKRANRRFLLFFSLVGWLLLVTVMARTFLGCSVNSSQIIAAEESNTCNISGFFENSNRTVEKIPLPNVFQGSLSFLWGNDGKCENPSHFDASARDVSKIAEIGAPPAKPLAKKPEKHCRPKRSALFQPIINRAASRYEVDPALVRAIIFAESGYNPAAVSHRGAMGLMQLMPGTAKAMGVEDCFDPEHNIYGGVRYFRKLFNQFDGDVTLALAAYNAGSRKVREFNGVPPYRATRHYIEKVLHYYHIYKDQQTEPLGLS